MSDYDKAAQQLATLLAAGVLLNQAGAVLQIATALLATLKEPS